MGNICGNPVRDKNESDQYNADGLTVPQRNKSTKKDKDALPEDIPVSKMMFEDKKRQEKQFSTAEAFNGNETTNNTARTNEKTTAQSSGVAPAQAEQKQTPKDVETKPAAAAAAAAPMEENVEEIAGGMADFAGMLGDSDEDQKEQEAQKQRELQAAQKKEREEAERKAKEEEDKLNKQQQEHEERIRREMEEIEAADAKAALEKEVEEARIAAEERVAQEKADEEAKIAAEGKATDEARIAAEDKASAEKAAEEKAAEEKAAEEKAAEEKAAEEARIAAEEVEAEKIKQDELAEQKRIQEEQEQSKAQEAERQKAKNLYIQRSNEIINKAQEAEIEKELHQDDINKDIAQNLANALQLPKDDSPMKQRDRSASKGANLSKTQKNKLRKKKAQILRSAKEQVETELTLDIAVGLAQEWVDMQTSFFENYDGTTDLVEFEQYIQKIDEEAKSEDIEKAFKDADKNNNEQLTIDEFGEAIFNCLSNDDKDIE